MSDTCPHCGRVYLSKHVHIIGIASYIDPVASALEVLAKIEQKELEAFQARLERAIPPVIEVPIIPVQTHYLDDKINHRKKSRKSRNKFYGF